MRPCEIWIEQCEATRQIEAEFGTQNALDYLIGEKFLNFLQAAETDAEFRAEIPAFVGGIKTIFETWQLAAYLERLVSPSRSIPASMMMRTRRRISTPKSSKMSGRMIFAVQLPTLLLVERPENGSWAKTISP